jgi:hypothetical protein
MSMPYIPPEVLEAAFVNGSQVARRLNITPAQSHSAMFKYGKRPVYIAGRAVWYAVDLDAVAKVWPGQLPYGPVPGINQQKPSVLPDGVDPTTLAQG